jgi:hypothetical protein
MIANKANQMPNNQISNPLMPAAKSNDYEEEK